MLKNAEMKPQMNLQKKKPCKVDLIATAKQKDMTCRVYCGTNIQVQIWYAREIIAMNIQDIITFFL